jgi:hypothetical protein
MMVVMVVVTMVVVVVVVVVVILDIGSRPSRRGQSVGVGESAGHGYAPLDEAPNEHSPADLPGHIRCNQLIVGHRSSLVI